MVGLSTSEYVNADYPLIVENEQQASRFNDVDEVAAESTSEQEFRDAAWQIIVQRNDFLLPNLIDMLETHQTLEVAPYYQRRARWDNGRKSRLIESFLINIPVPPIFLYENEFANYEVMDGQQRVTAIREFFDDRLTLRGLEMLTSLNGKRFLELPMQIRAGLQRRSLSAIILLKESAPSKEAITRLRRYVFERLNTGGIGLNAQEIRNCVHSGQFNDLLLKLSRDELFTSMWDIPSHEPNETTEPSEKLSRNVLFRSMRDAELVLRIFALMDPANVVGGMKRTLDNSMEKYSNFSTTELGHLESQFLQSLHLAHAIGGIDTFRVPTPNSERGRHSASLFDGIMVALIRRLKWSDKIEACATQIGYLIQSELEKPEFRDLVTGRANTREATLDRARHIENLVDSVIKA